MDPLCLSNLAQGMFSSGMMESTQGRVNISGVEPGMLGLLLDYAYTSKVNICSADVQVMDSHHRPHSSSP